MSGMQAMRRSFPRRYGRFHQHVDVTGGGGLIRGGGLSLQMPAPYPTVRQAGTDLPWMGMDPSSPVTWVRPYAPRAGMIGYLNFDGAQPNPAGGVQRGKQPFLIFPGGVAGSSVYNG